MSQYYAVLNESTLSEHITFAGNAAHHVRNFLTGKNNAEAPELLVVDQLAAQIENITRDMLSLVTHQFDIQNGLTNCIRCINLCLRTLSGQMPPHVLSKMEPMQFSLLMQHLQTAEALLSKVASMIVRAVTEQMVSSFQLKHLKLVDGHGNEHKHTEGDDKDGDAGIDLDFARNVLNTSDYALQTPVSNAEMKGFLHKCNAMAVHGSNASHQIQNVAAPKIRDQCYVDTAKNLIAIAGKMENEWRDIELRLYQYGVQSKTNPNVAQLQKNLSSHVHKQLDAISGNLQQIGLMPNKFDAIDAIEGSMQVLTAVFKTNFKLQFGE